jgi:hypothetical protein
VSTTLPDPGRRWSLADRIILLASDFRRRHAAALATDFVHELSAELGRMPPGALFRVALPRAMDAVLGPGDGVLERRARTCAEAAALLATLADRLEASAAISLAEAPAAPRHPCLNVDGVPHAFGPRQDPLLAYLQDAGPVGKADVVERLYNPRSPAEWRQARDNLRQLVRSVRSSLQRTPYRLESPARGLLWLRRISDPPITLASRKAA